MADKDGVSGEGERPLTAKEQKLVVEHLAWACSVVRRLGHRYRAALEDEDVKQLAREGLSRAARAYDVSQGVPFGGFAILHVRGAVLNAGEVEKRFHGPLMRECATWVDEGDVMEETEAEARDKLYARAGQGAVAMLFGIAGRRSHELATGGEEVAMQAIVEGRVREALAGLPERPREVIERRYFEEQEPLAEVAEGMALSVSTVRRECEEWLPKLGRRLAKAGVGT